RHPGGEGDARARRVLREVEAERRAGQELLLRLLAQLHRVVEDGLRLRRIEVADAKEVAARERDGQHPHASFAATPAEPTSPSRGGGAGGSNVRARTLAATCSWASRNGTPSRTSASAASVASSSGSPDAAASRPWSKSSPATSTVSAPSAPAMSCRAAKTGV